MPGIDLRMFEEDKFEEKPQNTPTQFNNGCMLGAPIQANIPVDNGQNEF